MQVVEIWQKRKTKMR